ncbi:nucleotidyltransferase [Vallitalea sediminicola]
MYDLSTEFDKFYRTKVVLPATVQNELREKRKLNIKRLENGLTEYNEENGTDYKICENRVQGSMAMHTVVQNDNNDYDIDVAIVFEKSKLGNLGPLATRNIVANALRRKTRQFNAEPEVKTSCVRIKYEDGYHVDFAVYRRYKNSETDVEYKYEHAGIEWTSRDIRAIDDWFKGEIEEKGKDLRKVIRFSKMFCKSRDSWKNMPSGLIQTVLCDEQLAGYTRIDELFYHTMKLIKIRLNDDVEVSAPVDNGRLLVTRDSDRQKMNNWKNRCDSKLKELDILFDGECTYSQAVTSWSEFFNHNYWSELATAQLSESFSIKKSCGYTDTEQFIEDMYDINERYDVYIDCMVSGNGFMLTPIYQFIETYAPKFKRFIPHNFTVKCKVGKTTAHSYDKVLWKVRNVGEEAERRNDIRGQIKDRGTWISENTLFNGSHYIECYLIKNNICVAIGHISIPIGIE